MSAMSNVFHRLEDLSAKLNATSDTITQALKDVEARLATLRLGIEVWLDTPLREDEWEGETITTRLGYAKANGSWHLVTVDNFNLHENGNPGLDLPKPLQQASRENRIEALKRLPELLEALEKKGKEQLHQIQKTLGHLSVAIEDLAEPLP
jgi:hypothetical protein